MNRTVKTAVLISGGGTNLQALIDAKAAGKLPHVSFCAVISNKEEAYGLVRAEKAGIPTHVVKKEKGRQEAFEKKLVEILESCGAELIVLAGFLAILSEEFVKKYPERIINIHPSLIPSFCGQGYYGLKVHEAALSYGVKVTGATVHFVNEIPDGGRILLQKAVEIQEGDTPEILQKRVMEEAEWKLLPRAVEMVAAQLCAEEEAS